MRAINSIYHAGSIAKAVESGRLKSGQRLPSESELVKTFAAFDRN